LTYNLTGTLDGLTLCDETVGTEEHDTDLAGLEVHAHTLNAGGEPEDGLVFRCGMDAKTLGVHILNKLLSLDVGHTVDTGDTITI
jgi:hypothetical protein